MLAKAGVLFLLKAKRRIVLGAMGKLEGQI
jgi:hypothetical protein